MKGVNNIKSNLKEPWTSTCLYCYCQFRQTFNHVTTCYTVLHRATPCYTNTEWCLSNHNSNLHSPPSPRCSWAAPTKNSGTAYEVTAQHPPEQPPGLFLHHSVPSTGHWLELERRQGLRSGLPQRRKECAKARPSLFETLLRSAAQQLRSIIHPKNVVPFSGMYDH